MQSECINKTGSNRNGTEHGQPSRRANKRINGGGGYFTGS
jgi:hypothetical protein